MGLLNFTKPPPALPGESVKLTPARARNCALVNQLATPGLGSLWGGRWVAGGGQLALAVIGFGLGLVWFGLTMRDFYGLINDQHSEPGLHVKWGLAGAGVFAVAWCWSWVTSISLLREARRNQ